NANSHNNEPKNDRESSNPHYGMYSRDMVLVKTPKRERGRPRESRMRTQISEKIGRPCVETVHSLQKFNMTWVAAPLLMLVWGDASSPLDDSVLASKILRLSRA